MALNKVHGEMNHGAHHLPGGKTAARRKEAQTSCPQAAKPFINRLLQVSKAFASFVKLIGF
ncbi:MAG: hypothetical protein WDN30_12765 [Pararobbsia sp.]